MDEILNLKPKEIETFSKIINEYIASQTSSSLSTLLSEPINYKVMVLDKRFSRIEEFSFCFEDHGPEFRGRSYATDAWLFAGHSQ